MLDPGLAFCYLCAMAEYIGEMYTIKEWNREQVRELVALAKQKGISIDDLARDWIDVHPGQISYWMSDKKSYREPTGRDRRLLSLIEPIIKRMKDKKKRGDRT